jgi:hypothetical protein
VGLTVDTGHAALGGLDPVQMIRSYPHRVAHVHCKDIRSEVFRKVISRGGGSFLDGVLAGMFTVPGDGYLDYAAVMQALAEIDYSGWIIVEAEQDPAVANPREYGEIGLATLKREGSRRGGLEGGVMSKLLVRAHAPDADGSILEVTPQSAGWTHVGFQVVKLAAGETYDGSEPSRETCVVVMSGTAEVTAEGVSFGKIGGRASVFEDVLPARSTFRPPRLSP